MSVCVCLLPGQYNGMYSWPLWLQGLNCFDCVTASVAFSAGKITRNFLNHAMRSVWQLKQTMSTLGHLYGILPFSLYYLISFYKVIGTEFMFISLGEDHPDKWNILYNIIQYHLCTLWQIALDKCLEYSKMGDWSGCILSLNILGYWRFADHLPVAGLNCFRMEEDTRGNRYHCNLGDNIQ